MNLNGALAVVTGASRGIGEATAKALAKEGAHVLLLARSQQDLDRVKSSIESSGGKAEALSVNLRDPQAIAETATLIKTKFGMPDLLINNAGAGRWTFIEDTSAQEIVEMMELPFFAAFNITREFLSGMKKRNSGTILNIASPGAYLPWPGSAGYSIGRWAIRGFSRSLRTELFKTDLHVCLVVAGETLGTAYYDANPGSKENLPRINELFPQMTADQLAKKIVSALKRDKKQLVAPYLLNLTMYLDNLFPLFFEWLVVKTGLKGKNL